MTSKIKNIKHSIKTISYYNIYFNGAAEIETPGYRGITHIIEHCMCQKVKAFEAELDKYAIDWNAVTSVSYMKFYMEGLSKYVKKFIDKFTEAILTYEITPEVFERERNIVLIEYKEHFSEKYGTYVSNFFRKYFNMNCAIGVLEDIENITYEQFIEFKNKYYSKPSEIVFLHPYNEADLTEVKSCTEFNDIPHHQFAYEYYPREDFKYESYCQFEDQQVVAFNSGILNYNDDSKFIASIFYLIDILSSGLSSPLYSVLREKYECIYGLHTSIEDLNDNNCMLLIYLFTPTEKSELALEKFKQLMHNMKKYLTKKEFKDSKMSLSNYIKKYLATSVFNIIGGQNNKRKEQLKTILIKKSLTYDEFMNYINIITSNEFHFYNTQCEEV